MNEKKLFVSLLLYSLFSINSYSQNQMAKDTLPDPYATKSTMNFSDVIGWKDAEMPIAPEGFTVTKYADGFDHPRWIYIGPNGDVFVAESNANYSFPKKVGAHIIGASKSNSLEKSANRITMLRDTNGDGIPDQRFVFLEKLNLNFGMLILGKWFYVANTNALVRYPYKTGQTKITSKGEKIMDLPAGKNNRHWTRNILANKEGTKIYIAIGSGTNVAEKGLANEILRANILEINPDGSAMRVYASGIRNPVGMAWSPIDNKLWTVVNERDELGDELVPDYLTHVEEHGFYGWPYVYLGNHIDPRVKDKAPDIVKKTLVPDVGLASHTASLGLAIYTGKSFPEKYHNGYFISQHGSWNRSVLSGYRVIFIPFANGKPSGKAEDFLTGFIVNPSENKVRGRPVGVFVMHDGSLLVTDDMANAIWRVSANNR